MVMAGLSLFWIDWVDLQTSIITSYDYAIPKYQLYIYHAMQHQILHADIR